MIEVGDTPGHEVRVYELRRSFPGNAPVINGVKVKEMIGSGMSDYVDGTGPNSNYTVFVLENGEKFFSRGTTLAQNTGSGKLSTVSVARITVAPGSSWESRERYELPERPIPKRTSARRSTKSSIGSRGNHPDSLAALFSVTFNRCGEVNLSTAQRRVS